MSAFTDRASHHPHASFADEDLPEGAWIDGETTHRDLDESFDFVVVGSGAAGAVAALELTRAGFCVAIVEEGGWLKTRDVEEDVLGIFQRSMRDGGMQAVEGRAVIPMLQGRAVGGSTLVNSAIAWRTPGDVIAEWSSDWGLESVITERALEPHFEALERELGVRAVDDAVLGENSRSFLARASEAGMQASATRRYERGCRGSARCLTGCPTGAKQSMNVTCVPWALRLGARLYSSCRVDRVLITGGRASGVLATTTHAIKGRATGRRVRLRARCGVVVAASAVQTPNLLRRSGLRSRDLGEHFQIHPSIACGGVMSSGVHMDFGATQGAESSQFRGSERFKVETVALPPELLSARIPGVGRELMGRLERYGDVAVWGLELRAEARGRVRRAWGGRDSVQLTLTERDLRRARTALSVIARMMFEHGATEVWPGVHGLPPVMTSADDLTKFEAGSLDPRAYGFIATHFFGSARMGHFAASSVVGPDFATHEAQALYVVDSSVFPTNIGVNPQHTIMAVARLAAMKIAESVATRAARSA